METYQIHINGIVQGVGFRPLVCHLAGKLKLNGYVMNGGDGLHIYFNSNSEIAQSFFYQVKKFAPGQARILFSELNRVADEIFSRFSVLVLEVDQSPKQVLLSPDKSICKDCRSELIDSQNRRYRYPFITCTQCGPRYSIIQNVPYERFNTTMSPFTFCESCKEEYKEISDRRYFSQTNSCAKCGIELKLHDRQGAILAEESEHVLSGIHDFLCKGKILAVKGVGGYLLLCDTNNSLSIGELRKKKHRPTKPFALLYPNIDQVRENFMLREEEEALLQSDEAPIVLLHPVAKPENISIDDIAPGLSRVGVMMPNSPILELIASDFGRPLVATSANISGSPIVYRDEDALESLFDVADYVVSYNREIVVPQDDSVAIFPKEFGQAILLRRSRGYAPSYLQYQPKKEDCVLSMGAFLKSSFSLSINGYVFVSQFLGNGEGYESQEMYKATLAHWLSLYEFRPEVILADLHPNYFTHLFALELANKYDIRVKFVQHHEAHFAAILSESLLLKSTEAILGVVWDGTGLGHDGNIWGGEFFKYEQGAMSRAYHFDYFPAIAGDKLASEPRLSALCTTHDVWPCSPVVKNKFTSLEWGNYQALIDCTNLSSSSVGRIFDAIASLLDLCDRQSYEGEAALYLQALAEAYVNDVGFEMSESYFKPDSHVHKIPTATLMQGVIRDIDQGKAKSFIAAKFHYTLVCLIDTIAQYTSTEHICFSGGVFQNSLLVDWVVKKLGEKYQLHFHKILSPNDENISFGQIVHFDNDINELPLTPNHTLHGASK